MNFRWPTAREIAEFHDRMMAQQEERREFLEELRVELQSVFEEHGALPEDIVLMMLWQLRVVLQAVRWPRGIIVTLLAMQTGIPLVMKGTGERVELVPTDPRESNMQPKRPSVRYQPPPKPSTMDIGFDEEPTQPKLENVVSLFGGRGRGDA